MVTTKQIKELREKTGAGVSDIKKALEENEGNTAKALVEIEKKLGGAALKKAGRETKAGLVEGYIHANGRIGVLVEILCETDFVARNPGFKELAHDLAMQVAALDPQETADLLEQPFIKDQGRTIKEVINEAIGKFGENIKLGRFYRLEM